jgi:hypothetical protein
MNTIIEQLNWRVSKARDMKWGEPYIQCRYGIIRQYDDGDLDVWVMNTRVASRLENTWKAKKHYDEGALFIQPYADLDVACRFLKARKRRKVSDRMREAGRILAERARVCRLAPRAS